MPTDKKLGPEDLARRALEQSRAASLRAAHQAGDAATRRMLEAAADDLKKRIAKRTRLGLSEEAFTHAQLKSTLKLVEETARFVALPGLRDAVLGTAIPLAAESADATVGYLAAMEAAYGGVGAQPLALDTARVLEAAREGIGGTVLRRLGRDPEHPAQPGVLARYGMETVKAFEEELQKGVIARKSQREMAEDITERSPFLQGKPAFWARRIVRTEVAHAQNLATHQAAEEADEQLGDVVKILLCPKDDRTGSDSWACHGQIRRPSEAFESWNGPFMYPPDRPNDRGTTVTHRIAWPIPPSLAWVDDGAVAAVWAREGHKTAMPGRPLMTTVALDLFGKEPEESASEAPAEEAAGEPVEAPAAPEEAAPEPTPVRVPRLRDDAARGRYALDQIEAMPPFDYAPHGFGSVPGLEAVRSPIPSFTQSLNARPPWTEAKQVRLEELTRRLRALEEAGAAPAPRQVRLDRLQSMGPDLLRDNLMTGAREAYLGQPGDVPVVVRSGGQLYAYENAEQLAARQLGGRKTASAHVVDLDAKRPWIEPPAPPKPPEPEKPRPIPIAFSTPDEFAKTAPTAYKAELSAAAREVFRSEKIPTVGSLEKVWGSEEAGHRIEIRRVSGGRGYDGERNVRFDGLIRNAAGGEIGTVTRTFIRHKSGEFEVHHDFFKIEDVAEQGKKTGESMLRQAIQTYEQLGVNKVTVDAAWVGRYAWGQFGYNWTPEFARARVAPLLTKFLIDNGVEKSRAAVLAEGAAPRSWAVGKLDVDGKTVMAKGEQHGKEAPCNLGKAFLFQGGINIWSGRIVLDPAHETYQRARERIKL